MNDFNYVVDPEIYYSGTHLDFNVTFYITISSSCSGTDESYSLYPKYLTRSQSLVSARGIAYTNITRNVIPLSLC